MTDPWADWLLHRRDGGDPATREATAVALDRIRDRVLADAEVGAGDHVLDVGCGLGLVGARAAELVGQTGRVTFSDISPTLLEHCRVAMTGAGLVDRCRFAQAALPDLAELPSGAYDAVTIRSVLIYVADKRAALRAVRRVLRPGGRLALFEPINSFRPAAGGVRLWGFGVSGAEAEAEAVHALARADAQEYETMLGFDERDLFAHALEAGFEDVRMDYHAEVAHTGSPSRRVDAFLATAPNPLSPTYAELLDSALDPAAARRLRERLARAMAEGDYERRAATVHLRARVPAAASNRI